ncbi:hypothetical protein QWY20_16250 [Alkalimonas sp. MEB108]|uniref:Lipoprotein n=1 Tax=Alkalimonas cellulosilytica TaxID=3058395 RepID=A0ABU7J8Z0_9GAMM|nr:hypothetical protein [Alkalimonas sp. MEB108]MEE2003011.1 hypothetical protein [Alkalimonas sp. MEB108]
MKKISAFAIATAACLMTACNGESQATPKDTPASTSVAEQQALAANTLCQVDQNFDISACRDGNRFVFQPTRFGNEQLPISVIAAFCDIHQPIHFNKAGVVCIFKRM